MFNNKMGIWSYCCLLMPSVYELLKRLKYFLILKGVQQAKKMPYRVFHTHALSEEAHCRWHDWPLVTSPDGGHLNYWSKRTLSARLMKKLPSMALALDAANSESKNVSLINSKCLQFVFIARRHTDAQYWYCNSVRLSVCLSLRNTLVLYENCWTHCHSFFSPYGSLIIL